MKDTFEVQYFGEEYMDSIEPKKLALIRIWQILKEHSDYDHPLTQDEISEHLKKEYGISIERRAVSRNLSLLKEAGVEIESGNSGSYLESRDFDDSELRLLIDGVLCSKHITAKHSKDLINRLCGLSNKYFKSHVKHVYSVNDWNKTDNQQLFYNIELVDSAIEQKRRIKYTYNKLGADKKMHKTSSQSVSPYQLILHNQRYYLMAFCEYWGNMVFHRLDCISNMEITESKATPLKSVPGYEKGIDYKRLSSAMPYMYADEPQHITLLVRENIIDQVIDWFGSDIKISRDKDDEKMLNVVVFSSPDAMVHWAMQYLDYVEVKAPESVRARIRESLKGGIENYN